MNHIDRAYRDATRIKFDDCSKFVIMSDCHRGCGGWADSFSINKNNFFVALQYYHENEYTYIELGDGDELWENRRFSDITFVHDSIFWLLSQFYRDNRLYMLYGNHDIVKRKKPDMMKCFYDIEMKMDIPLFPGVSVYESLILQRQSCGAEIFLLHGHQADWFNDYFWRLGRFLVRYFWSPLQMFGIKNPTSAAVNQRAKLKVEKKLQRWSESNKKIIIAGHTHRPMLPHPGEHMYCNDGSCVHPRSVTAIEISGGTVALVKWGQKTKPDGVLYIGRDVLAGPYHISNYYEGKTYAPTVKHPACDQL